MEEKQIKAFITKVGGNASKNATRCNLIIPADWARKMGITKDNPYLIATFDGQTMTIEKA